MKERLVWTIRCVKCQLQTLRKFDMDIQYKASSLIHFWIILASMRLSSQKTSFGIVDSPCKRWNWANNNF